MHFQLLIHQSDSNLASIQSLTNCLHGQSTACICLASPDSKIDFRQATPFCISNHLSQSDNAKSDLAWCRPVCKPRSCSCVGILKRHTHTHTYTLEKPQRAVEPYGPYWNLLANLVTFLYLPTFALFIFLLMICLLDNPAVHSSTQELSAGTFTAPVTGLFVGHPPVTRGMAPC